MNKAPLIGIPCRHDYSLKYRQKPVNAQGEAYLPAISQAGGIPFLIPLNLEEAALRRLYDLAAGILLTGGGDIEPSFYEQETQTDLADLQPDRDELEMRLSRWAAADGKPVLGICRGIQVMAVAVGGNLCQDIPSQMPAATLHQYIYNDEGSHPDDYLAHAVELEADSRLARILQTSTIQVNSMHHQAVDSVPAPYRVVGRSTDGVVEALELPEHPFFCGVQWHPEVLLEKEAAARQIFAAFVEACRNGAAG